MLFALPILALLSELRTASAQSSSISFVETVIPLWPTGVSMGSTSISSTLPLACFQGCFPVTTTYFGCFINVTQSDGGLSPEDQGYCDDFFCSQGNFTQLLDCANCIIANGGEDPSAYPTTTETATSTESGGIIEPIVNPLGVIDAEQLTGWLANVTGRCSSIDRSITGDSSATATPTTTGPYNTSFEANETISFPTWTGLTQYPPPVYTVSIPASEGVSGPGSSASSGNSNTGNGSPTSSAAPSESSPANGAISGKAGSAGLTALGMMVGYVVVQLL